jgi:hypothetical protein
MNLIDPSIGSSRAYGKLHCRFPRSELTDAPPPSWSSAASTAKRSSLSSGSCPTFPFSC